MQFLSISRDTKLSDLSEQVGSRNVPNILHINNLDRTPNIGEEFESMAEKAIEDAPDVTPERKSALLNNMTTDSDIFEVVALGASSSWKLLSSMSTLPHMLRIPDNVRLPDSTAILGNGQPIGATIYNKVMTSLKQPPHTVDPSIFNEYSSITGSGIISVAPGTTNDSDPMQWFRVPWGEVSLYSSLHDEKVDFPVYPNELQDSARASYDTMPDLLYQYEPWQMYKSSGPRTHSYTFEFHRDMWTGDHRDGRANDLIRACMANCYPEYRGSAVYTSLVTLYIAGKPLITGVMTDVTVDWDGPLGLDSWYLHCRLTLSITEVSQQALDYTTVRNKPLIG